MYWWMWCIIGTVLLALELIVPGGFFMFMLGLGALAVGGLVLVGAPLNESAQYLAFAGLSFVFMITLRKKLSSKFFSSTPDVTDELTGKEVVMSEAISPGAEGSCDYRGSVWRTINSGSMPLNAGDKAIVEKVDGLSLRVRKI